MKCKPLLSFIGFLCLFSACSSSKVETTQEEAALPDSTFIQIAREAYTFGLPLVIMDLTHRQLTNGDNPDGAPENEFKHHSSFPDASFRNVVRPNADTYYSSANLNLKNEPLVLSLPDTKGRYYMMPILDAYSNVFASPGSRTTGTKAINFLITGPGWSGTVPAGMTQISSPTNSAWIIGRTQVNSKEDGEKVVIPLQKQYKLTPLSSFGKTYTPTIAAIDPSLSKEGPNEIIQQMPIDEFFNYFTRLLQENPPAAEDVPAIERFAEIGLKSGAKFDINTFSGEVQKELIKIPAETWAAIKQEASNRGVQTGGWQVIADKTGSYGTDYKQRAFVACVGLGANLAEDALYPSASVDSEGNAFNGSNNYVIHFDKGQTPPCNAFWSITVYDESGYLTANPINRYAIGDRSSLKTNTDGSTDIYLQQTSPGKNKESNWLPVPPGAFNLLLRVYWPKEPMLNGTWKPNPVKKVNQN